jgi:hypothetical protein
LKPQKQGYDLSNIILTPQDPLYSKYLTQWIGDVEKKMMPRFAESIP